MKTEIKTESAAEAFAMDQCVDHSKVALPDEENLLAVPPAKAILASFPPGCPVLYTNIANGSPIVTNGRVKAVFVDLTPGKSSRDYFFKLLLGHSTEVIAGEMQIQLAIQCPVWLYSQGGAPAAQWQEAIVVGSYQDEPFGKAQYSVQANGKGLFHGVSKENLRYRSPSDVPFTLQDNSGNVPAPQEATQAVTPHDRITRVFETPTTSISDSVSRDVPLPRPGTVRPVSNVPNELPSSNEPPSLRGKRPSSPGLPLSDYVYATANDQHVSPTLKKQKVVHGDLSHITAVESRHVNELVPAQTMAPVESSNAASSAQQDVAVPPLSKIESTSTMPPSQRIGSGTKNPLVNATATLKTSLPAPTTLAIESGYEAYGPPTGHEAFSGPVEDASIEWAYNDEEISKVTINVPLFAERIPIREAIIGTAGMNHKRLLYETGCHRINMCGHNAPDSEQMKIMMECPRNKIDIAQRIVEDAIVSTVVDPHQRARMLYYLAVDNDYGASEGRARYQRSPRDSRLWCWLAIVEVPRGFEKCSGLFMDTKARAILDIIRTTGCRVVNLTQSHPRHVYLISEDENMVNNAVAAVEDRIRWAVEQYERRSGRSLA